MTHRFLYFDINTGCSIESLNGALCGLLDDLKPIQRALTQAGIDHLSPYLKSRAHKKQMGLALVFNDSDDKDVSKSYEQAKFLKHIQQKLGKKTGPSVNRKRELLEGRKRTSDEVIDSIRDLKEGSSLVFNLAKKILTTYFDAVLTGLENERAQLYWAIAESELMVAQVLAFSVVVAELSPMEVGISSIPICVRPVEKGSAVETMNISAALELCKGVPSQEFDLDGPHTDALCLAMLRSVAGYFGLRKLSEIERVSVGMKGPNDTRQSFNRVLLCRDVLSSAGAVSLKAEAQSLLNVSAVLGKSAQAEELLRLLEPVSLASILTSQVSTQRFEQRTRIEFFALKNDLDKALELLLVVGETREVAVYPVEHVSLRKREVCVPLGRMQKQKLCRVTEWMLGEKIVRADPLEQDLLQLSKNEGFPQDVVRSDVLSAWKKWRVHQHQEKNSVIDAH